MLPTALRISPMDDVSIGKKEKEGKEKQIRKKNRPSPLLFKLPLPPTDPSGPRE